MKQIKLAIVGSGPSGVFCALNVAEAIKNFPSKNAAQENIKIDLYDAIAPLSTLLPTGGGRCNLTNAEEDFKKFASNYPRGEKFLYSLFSRHFMPETLSYFEKIGVKTYKQADGRIFPVSNSAKSVRASLLSALKKFKNVQIVQKCVKSAQELCQYDIIVLATGAKDRHSLAEQFGHSVIPFVPALCGVKIKEKGPEFPVGVSIESPEGGILFTHLGLSGPKIYKMTSLRAKNGYPFEIKIPILAPEALFEAINRYPKRKLLNIVSNYIPKSLAKYLFVKNNIDLEKQSAHAKKDEIEKLSTLILTAESPDGKGETVHAGGVNLKEIDKNCRSKINPKLWIIGEALDIDGFCGGFNLQNCWSTGAVAAMDIVNFINELNKN